MEQIHEENNLEKFNALDEEKRTELLGRLEKQNYIENNHVVIIQGNSEAINSLEEGLASEEKLDMFTLTTDENKKGGIPVDHTLFDGTYSSSRIKTKKIMGGFMYGNKEKSANMALPSEKMVTEVLESSDFYKRKALSKNTVEEMFGNSFKNLNENGLDGIYNEYDMKSVFQGSLKSKLD